jgi:hypothetical protein
MDGVAGAAFALLNSGIVAFDIDDCRDPTTGVLHEWAEDLVKRCGSYAEITPSNAGIRILGTGSGPKIHRKLQVANGVSCEVYRNAERFITITGRRLESAPDQFADLDSIAEEIVAALDAAKQQAKQKRPPPGADGKDRTLEDIIKNGCGTSFGGDKSRAVWFVINAMLRTGSTKDEITAALINPDNGISTHLLSQKEDPIHYAHRQIDKAFEEQRAKSTETPEADPDAAEIATLATLDKLAYEKVRKEVAERMSIRASVLDKLVEAERARQHGEDGGDDLQGRAIELSEPETWPHAVNGAELLDAITAAILTYVVLSIHAARSCACWVVHTFLIQESMFSPRLGITSATKGCGKTTLLDVLSRLVLRALSAANVSTAALYRAVEIYHPTFMVDEVDTFLHDNPELRGVLNSGHRKGGSVLRIVGEQQEPRWFSTYGAVAIACIGELPGTLADRSIPIRLKRRRAKNPEDAIKRFRSDRADHLTELARKAARWAQDNAIAVGAADPDLPEEIHNRAADNFRTLKSIAVVAGGKWPDYIDEAAKTAQQEQGTDATSRLELLLNDIQAVAGFPEIYDPCHDVEVRSLDLVQRLIEKEGSPWAEMGKSRKPLTQTRLARMLDPLGITPGNIGPDDARVRGYRYSQFVDAFERYCVQRGG